MSLRRFSLRGYSLRHLVAGVAVAGGVVLSISASSALASELVYTPTSPSFGGSPLNSSHLFGLANAQNEYKAKADAAAARQTATSMSDRFIQMLQTRLYSSLASQVSEAIFGENAQDQGRIKFDDQEVSWVNTGTEVRLLVTDQKTGQISEIIIPTITQ